MTNDSRLPITKRTKKNQPSSAPPSKKPTLASDSDSDSDYTASTDEDEQTQIEAQFFQYPITHQEQAEFQVGSPSFKDRISYTGSFMCVPPSNTFYPEQKDQ